MKQNIQIGMTGEQRIKLIRKGEVVSDTGLFSNTLLNAFFDRLTNPSPSRSVQSSDDSTQTVALGIGTTAVDNTDIVLENQVLEHEESDDYPEDAYVGVEGDTAHYTVTRTWTVTADAAYTITEMGTNIDSYDDDDDEGNLLLDTRAILEEPIVTQVDDTLVVTHVRHIYVSLLDVTATLSINDIDYSYKIRAVNSSDIFIRGGFTAMNRLAVSDLEFWCTNATSDDSVELPEAGEAWGTQADISDYNAAVIENEQQLSTLSCSFTARALPDYLLPSEGIGIRTLVLHSESDESTSTRVVWLAEFTPNLPKTEDDTLTLSITLTYSRGGAGLVAVLPAMVAPAGATAPYKIVADVQ